MASGIRHIASNNTLSGIFKVKRDVVYSTATGTDLTLDVIYSWATDYTEEKPVLPLVVFVQGSGWTTPDRGGQLPQLGEFARRGFVVATVGHRSIFEGHPLPAQLVDVKCAIRFLRAHARDYGIDPARVAIWGTSSGAHVAQVVGVTAGIARFETEEWADQSDAVCAVVSSFSPCDLTAWIDYNRANPDNLPFIERLVVGGEDERSETMRAMSAIEYVSRERADSIPPYFLSVGTEDPLVEVSQVTHMYEALAEAGVEAEAVLVDGAVHEANYWSQEVLDLIWSFLARNLAR